MVKSCALPLNLLHCEFHFFYSSHEIIYLLELRIRFGYIRRCGVLKWLHQLLNNSSYPGLKHKPVELTSSIFEHRKELLAKLRFFLQPLVFRLLGLVGWRPQLQVGLHRLHLRLVLSQLVLLERLQQILMVAYRHFIVFFCFIGVGTK